MEKLLFSVKEAAEMLYVIKQGKLGYLDLGAKKIPKAEIDRFIRENITYSQR